MKLKQQLKLILLLELFDLIDLIPSRRLKLTLCESLIINLE